jgi:hypothetical protein
MPLSIELTTGWSTEKMARHWPSVIACLHKYVDRFPKDATVQGIILSIVTTKRQLWAVLDESGELIMTPITEVETIDDTGEVRLRMVECAGERLQEAMPLIAEIERWGREEMGATSFELVGRKGWERLLKPHGYEPYTHIYRKAI